MNGSMINLAPDTGTIYGQEKQSTNPELAGEDKYIPFTQLQSAKGISPRGGIDYIDQAATGVIEIRNDALQRAESGIYPQRMPFTGQTIQRSILSDYGTVSGYVGATGNQQYARAAAETATAMPDRGSSNAAMGVSLAQKIADRRAARRRK